jgi:hypothetical protein
MFAINKRTGRKIVEVEVVDTLYVEDFESAACYDRDGHLLISPAEYEAPNPVVLNGTDDSGEECEAKDIVLVKALPEGYDEDGEWIEDSDEHDAKEGIR